MTPPKNVHAFNIPQSQIMDYYEINTKNEELKNIMQSILDTEEGQMALSMDKQDGNLDGTISADNWKKYVNTVFANPQNAEQYYAQGESLSILDVADMIKQIKAVKEEVLEDGTVRKYNPDKSYSDNYKDGSVKNYDSQGKWIGGVHSQLGNYVRFQKDNGRVINMYKYMYFINDAEQNIPLSTEKEELIPGNGYATHLLDKDGKIISRYRITDLMKELTSSEVVRLSEQFRKNSNTFGL